MPERLLIGLTGGLGAGKSEALKAFARAGADTISLDRIARELSRKGGPIHRAATRAFGRGVLKAGGELDRRALARKVFRDPAARRRLEGLAHPVILRELGRRLARARRRVAVVDAPLLFEAGLERLFDVTMLVTAPRRLRLERVRRRDGMTAGEFAARARAQLPEAAKRRRADVVVANDRGLSALRRAAREYYMAFELISAGRGGKT